jgi:hypothetical protein
MGDRMQERYIGIDLTKNDYASLDNLINIGLRGEFYNFTIFDPEMKSNELLYEKISMLRELQRTVEIISHRENAHKDTWWVGEEKSRK